MITDQRKFEIKSSPEQVFQQFENNPFPTFKILDTRAFLFIRLVLIDSIKTGWRVTTADSLKKTNNEPIEIGSSLGPFTLIEVERPSRYILDLKSRFFNCQTGYVLSTTENGTLLSFGLVAENPSPEEKLWWFFIKPIHVLLANKVLKNIQREAELSANNNY